MAKDLNKVQLIGRLGADPELRYTQAGKAVTSFSVATGRSWKDGNGETQEATEWHRVIAWEKLGEICNEYLRKGSKVYIEGRLQTRKWEDKEGNDRWTTEIIANDMIMLDSKRDSGYQDEERSAERPRRNVPEPIDDSDIPF